MADQQGIMEILSKLDDDEIYALAKTVTQGLLKIENKDGKISKSTLVHITIHDNFRCNSWNITVLPKCS